MKYYFKDFDTGKTRFTRGKFVGFTQPTGLLAARYAIFARKSDNVLVPEYLLTARTKDVLNKGATQ